MTRKVNIDIDSRFIRNTEILSTDMDGETVMMSINKGKYFGINPSGSIIWALLEQPRNVAEIVDTLISKYDVSAESCQEEVIGFLMKLKEKKLIEQI